jgi:hypothetical protein
MATGGAHHTLSDPLDAQPATVDQVVQISGFTGRGALIYGEPETGPVIVRNITARATEWSIFRSKSLTVLRPGWRTVRSLRRYPFKGPKRGDAHAKTAQGCAARRR